jgi:cellulose synthase/poly-beta-1,6-N-acetylglucosamine synthase-like glycosyltransferase
MRTAAKPAITGLPASHGLGYRFRAIPLRPPPVPSDFGMSFVITLLYGSASVFLAAFGVWELRMLAQFLRNRAVIRGAVPRSGSGAAPRNDRVTPTVTIQIPLFNERTAAEQIILAAAAQEYPKDRFDIQVLDDSTDETPRIVAKVVEQVTAKGVKIQHIRRDNRQGYKAGALAEGLQRSRAEFVAVFDADFVPETGFLRRLLVESHAFDDPTVAFVQARWAWGSVQEGWLPSALALLLDRHFRVQKPTREFAGNVTTFNGSGGIWRRKAIDSAGGWTSDTLTEDLDLSYRCALEGWHGRYLADVMVQNELPGHMRAFKLQQRRWARGSAQCVRKLTGRVMSARQMVRHRWDEAFMLAGYAIHPLLLASLLLWPWAVVYVDRRLFWVLQGLMSLGMIAALASFLITVHERDEPISLGTVGRVVVSLCVGMGLMVNNTVGQLQGFATAGGEFVRTPKKKRTATDSALAALGAEQAYASPLHWTFYAEVLVMAYCLAGAAFLLQHGEGLWSLAMFFWASCLGLMVQQQMAPSLA